MRWLTLLLLMTALLWSAPAYSAKRQFRQPDGSTFTAHAQGDEYLHWVETEDEEILLYNKKTKQFEYAVIKEGELQPSGEAHKAANGTKHAPRLHPKLNKKALHGLWKEKRQNALMRRRKSH